jgi:hypothetical protein
MAVSLLRVIFRQAAGVVPGASVLNEAPRCGKTMVDRGFMVDPVDWGTPNQPHNPDQPRKRWIIRAGE